MRGRCPCAWPPPLPRLLSVCVCVSLVEASSATINREQGPNKLSLPPKHADIVTEGTNNKCSGSRARALSLTHSLSLPCLPLPLPLYSRVSSDQIKGGVESNAAKVVGQFSGMRFYPQIAFSEIDLQLFAVFDPKKHSSSHFWWSLWASRRAEIGLGKKKKTKPTMCSKDSS